MAALTPTPKQQIYGSDGNPLVGGKIYTYAAGTTTPLATYTDAGGLTANTNPIILNSLGQANIWLAPASSYKFSVYTSADVLLYTVDNIASPIDYLSLVTSLASPPPIGSTAPNTGAFTTLTATTGTITTVNCTTVSATTVNAATVTATGTVTAETLTFEGGGSLTKPPEPGIPPVAATVAANALTVTLNPTTLDFRSATLGSGAVVSRLVSSAISLVVSSGSTLGTSSGVQSRIAILALDNAGTVELAVINVAGGVSLTEAGLISTTAEGGGGAADSISTAYSTAARTSVAYRVVGYLISTQTTAGTWATTPSTVQSVGGLVVPGSLIQNGTAVATTSGTSFDFTGIPNYVKRITVMFKGVSGNGTSDLLIQLGSGSVATSGYTSVAWGNGAGAATSTAGFRLTNANNTGYFNDGMAIITLFDPLTFKWTSIDNIGSASGTVFATGAGAVTLSGVLDRLRITTVIGTDIFDAGDVNILWE